MLVWLIVRFYDFFAVFDPSPLTVCINCSFFYIYNNYERSEYFCAVLTETKSSHSRGNLVRHIPPHFKCIERTLAPAKTFTDNRRGDEGTEPISISWS